MSAKTEIKEEKIKHIKFFTVKENPRYDRFITTLVDKELWNIAFGIYLTDDNLNQILSSWNLVHSLIENNIIASMKNLDLPEHGFITPNFYPRIPSKNEKFIVFPNVDVYLVLNSTVPIVGTEKTISGKSITNEFICSLKQPLFDSFKNSKEELIKNDGSNHDIFDDKSIFLTFHLGIDNIIFNIIPVIANSSGTYNLISVKDGVFINCSDNIAYLHIKNIGESCNGFQQMINLFKVIFDKWNLYHKDQLFPLHAIDSLFSKYISETKSYISNWNETQFESLFQKLISILVDLLKSNKPLYMIGTKKINCLENFQEPNSANNLLKFIGNLSSLKEKDLLIELKTFLQ
jgi:hypothetical protein